MLARAWIPLAFLLVPLAALRTSLPGGGVCLVVRADGQLATAESEAVRVKKDGTAKCEAALKLPKIPDECAAWGLVCEWSICGRAAESGAWRRIVYWPCGDP